MKEVFLKKRTLLSKTGAQKKVYHLIFDIKETSLTFHPGDSATILPKNDPNLVDKTLHSLRACGKELIEDPFSHQLLTLRDFLLQRASITRFPKSMVRYLQEHQHLHSPISLEENDPHLAEFLHTYELWDLLDEFKNPSLSFQDFIRHLYPLSPRYYSISSSQKMYPSEIHLTVQLATHTTHNILRHGVASHYLTNLVEIDKTPISLSIAPSHGFHLPSAEKNIIMVGAGTGIAPFHSFLQERFITQSTGKNWLFFGEQHRSSDFYYEDFLLDLEKRNFLRLDLAFSRDSDKKVYVQDLLYERRKDLWQWLQNGSYLYICGSASKMAKDVELTLKTIIREEGNKNEEDALQYLRQLRHEKRYLKDIY